METSTNYQRFNFDADTHKEATEYIFNRSKQLLRLGYILTTMVKHDWGVEAFYDKLDSDEVFQVLYILKSARGNGVYKKHVTMKILTTVECKIANFLEFHGIDHIVETLTPFKEYEIISNYYGSGKAKRSGVDFMNHIDEGLAILEYIGASELAKKAYCLHPIYQSDSDLLYNQNKYKVDGDVMLRVMEYRSIANEYLSKRTIQSIDEIRLSPLKDVNDMLIADKIQNYKDFELYHKGTHPRSVELNDYFKNWLKRLGLQYYEYAIYKKRLRVFGEVNKF